jgi:hypothetical protein
MRVNVCFKVKKHSKPPPLLSRRNLSSPFLFLTTFIILIGSPHGINDHLLHLSLSIGQITIIFFLKELK